MRQRIDEYIDRTKAARHLDRAYYNAINAATNMILKDRIAPIRIKRKYSIQSTQRVRDELYTLIPAPVTGSTTASAIVAYPADYYYYLQMYITIAGIKNFCSPTTYNEIGPLEENPFSKPSAVKPYFNELATGLKIHWGSTGAVSFELTYLRQPATVTIGKQSNKILAGGTLTNAITYLVYEEAVYAAVTYEEGDTITGTGAALTSGIVIETANIVNSDLPVNMHEEICKQAAAIMEGTVEQFNKKQDLSIDVEKS